MITLENVPTFDGLCAETDPELFFPEKGGATREAKQVCAACPVREECLEYALDNNERFGIWGGRSERERRKLAEDRVRTCRDCGTVLGGRDRLCNACRLKARRASSRRSDAAA